MRRHSPTAWVQGMARRADLQESVFWRYLKAGRIYLELTGETELAPDVSVSAESLELADKIRRHAPKAVTSQVVERTLDGGLGREQLRDVWATYRPASGGATARGRLPIDRRPGRTFSRRVRPPGRPRSASPRTAPRCVARAEHSERLELHGLWTCVSTPELSDSQFQGAPGTASCGGSADRARGRCRRQSAKDGGRGGADPRQSAMRSVQSAAKVTGSRGAHRHLDRALAARLHVALY